MKTIYLLLPVLFSSCYVSSRFEYLGSSFAPTSEVDIFVAESAIKKPYDIVGKSVAYTSPFRRVEAIQDKAVQKAKEKGADAILIKDYIMNDGILMHAQSQRDSTGKGQITFSNAQANNSYSRNLEIFYIKYKN